jgi:hypothetical protein
MKNLIKITTMCSLLIIACFLISACGGGAESFVQGKGTVDIFVTDTNTTPALPLQNVTIEVRENNAQGTLIETHTNATDAKGFFQWVSPTTGVGSTFHFTFILAGYVTQTATATPNLTGPNVTLNVRMPHV